MLDESGNPLAGANITVEGTDFGSATDEDGSFSIEEVDLGSIVVASSIGYESLELSADSSFIVFNLIQEVIEMTELEVLASGRLIKQL